MKRVISNGRKKVYQFHSIISNTIRNIRKVYQLHIIISYTVRNIYI